MSETIRFEDFLKEQLRDPEFREEWERTAYARAIANQVIRYRAAHGLSQAALARKLGVSQPVVGRLELGEHEPKVSTLRTLSEKLGMSFVIAIHPAGSVPPETPPTSDEGVERIVSGGVEMLVRAG
jgi:ribosome-binding protein aMBF1 (putative translation factor)